MNEFRPVHLIAQGRGACWRGSRLCFLPLLASLACTTTDDAVGPDAQAAGSSDTGGADAQDSTGASSGGPGGAQSPSGAIAGSAGPGSSTTGVSVVTATTSAPAAGGLGSAGGGLGSGGAGGPTDSNSASGNGTAAAASGAGASTDGVDPGSGGTGALTTSDATAGGAGGADEGNTGAGGRGTAVVSDAVTLTSSTFTFEHFPIETDPSGVWNGPLSPVEEPTSTTYDTVVLENGYLRVTLLPDYGGRILSIVHKPTNRELLYQNPLGTPYLMQEGIFYYDYLVIMGGIFPSFPEPEHGKYWNLPYQLEVVSESSDAITVRMSRQDDLDLAVGVPEKYDVGRTDVLVQVEVTLRAGSSGLELDTTLTNTRSSAVPNFEFWMVNTLAPGSTPGETSIPLNTRILAAMDRVHLLESSWSWFADAEERVNEEVFNWNNLSHFENWVDQGTAFANPNYQANWWGLVNYDREMGILRVSDNVETPGLKLWTFGKGSLDIDINDSDQWLRPTIEMWYGITPEFWNRGSLAANEVRRWSDSYFATLGLKEVTAASEYGALYLSASQSGTDTVLSAAATLTLPGQTVSAILRLDGTVISEQDVVVAATEATTLSATLASSEISPGAVFEVEFLQGASSVLSGQTTLQ